MELDKALESSQEWYWIEMGRTARKIVEEVFPIKPGENVVITADTMSDWRLVTETAKAIYALGAQPTVIVHPTTDVPSGDPPLPVIAAVQAADAWIEYNDSYLLYSTAWTKAMEAGVRFLSLGGDVDGQVRMIGRVDYAVLDRLANKLVELSNKASKIHIACSLGTDLTIDVDPKGSVGHVIRPGTGVTTFSGTGSFQGPPGQAGFGFVPESVEGTLVFDGAIFPPVEIGVLREPVRLQISKGRITNITGGKEAVLFERWLASWNHPGMYVIGHCTYGFNPGVKRCKGSIGHDERVFGCIEFGIGPKWEDAPAHTDGVVLRPSIWADDVQLEENGKYVHPELVELGHLLGVDGY